MSNLLTNVPAFIFALGVIIFVHELGHLIVAKLFGVRVLTFSLGFGKRLFGVQRGETDWRVSAVPLGGYVRLGGETAEEATGDPREFTSKPRWQRILVYLAGPAMNFVLAVALIAGAFMVGVEVSGLRDVPPVVGAVEPSSPAAKAGIEVGDRVVALDGETVTRWQQFAETVLTAPERKLAVTIVRGERQIPLEITPAKDPKYGYGDVGVYPRVLPRIAEVFAGSPAAAAGFRAGDEVRAVDGRAVADAPDFVAAVENRAGQAIAIDFLRDGKVQRATVTPAMQDGKGRIGVRLGAYQRFPFGQAVVESVRYNLDLARQTLVVMGKIFTRDIAAKSALSGPIEIAAWSGAAARSGFKNLIFFMGMISVSIGLLNLFPIPLLDGGQIFVLAVEGLLRRDLSLAVKERINQVGFVLILMLMGTVLIFDLMKNLPPSLVPGS